MILTSKALSHFDYSHAKNTFKVNLILGENYYHRDGYYCDSVVDKGFLYLLYDETRSLYSLQLIKLIKVWLNAFNRSVCWVDYLLSWGQEKPQFLRTLGQYWTNVIKWQTFGSVNYFVPFCWHNVWVCKPVPTGSIVRMVYCVLRNGVENMYLARNSTNHKHLLRTSTSME